MNGTVAPGATYKFKFDLAATKPGTYDEHFGVVEEGVSWFTDPPDDQLEVKITVLPKDGGPPPSNDAGTKSDAGATHDSGTTGDNEDAYPPSGCNQSGSSTPPFGAFALFGIVVISGRRRGSAPSSARS